MENQQPIIVDERPPKLGDTCLLCRQDEFVLAVFELDSPFGKVFRPKGFNEKITVDETNEIVVYKVISVKNPSDVESEEGSD